MIKNVGMNIISSSFTCQDLDGSGDGKAEENNGMLSNQRGPDGR
jgi:hypothetical protein